MGTSCNQIPARVANHTPLPQAIHQGTYIGCFYFHTIDDTRRDLVVSVQACELTDKQSQDIVDMLDTIHLPDAQLGQLAQLLNEFRDVFSTASNNIGRTWQVLHTIPTVSPSGSHQRGSQSTGRKKFDST